MKQHSFKKYLCCINMLYDTRVSLVLTPGCQAYQHPGASMLETRVSYNLFM